MPEQKFNFCRAAQFFGFTEAVSIVTFYQIRNITGTKIALKGAIKKCTIKSS